MLSEALCYCRSVKKARRLGMMNDEANLNVYDADFAREQTRVFEDDRTKSHRVTLAEWKHRPLSEKIMEHAAGLLRSQL
jgi:cardiolipin synthase